MAVKQMINLLMFKKLFKISGKLCNINIRRGTIFTLVGNNLLSIYAVEQYSQLVGSYVTVSYTHLDVYKRQGLT